MSDNMFWDCGTVQRVIAQAVGAAFGAASKAWIDCTGYLVFDSDAACRITADAEGRIAELTQRTVDAAGRERARAIVSGWLFARGMSTTGIGLLLDEIIDALGWTVADAPHQCADVQDDCCERTPAPATPAVELDAETVFRFIERGKSLVGQDARLTFECEGRSLTLYRNVVALVLRIGGGDD